MKTTVNGSGKNRVVFGAAALALALLTLAGCGGGGGGGEDERSRVVGTWRIAEIGAQGGGTDVCPAEVDLGNGLSVNCGNSDALAFGDNGSFIGTFRDPANPDAAAGTATGTWTYDDGADTAVISVTEIRQDNDGNGQIDQEEITEVDPALRIDVALSAQTETRLTADLRVDGIFDDNEARYRVVLTRP